MRRFWIDEEERTLKKWYGREPVRKTAARLLRSIYAVKSRASKLNLGKRHDFWSRREDAILQEWFWKETQVELAKRLGRTPGGIKTRAMRLGLKKQIQRKTMELKGPWSAREDAILRRWYENETYEELGKRLDRPWDGVRARAKKLGLKRRLYYWTKQEEIVLITHYANRGAPYVGKLLGRSPNGVIGKAAQLGVKSNYARRWQAWEVRLLKKEWSEKRLSEIARALGRSRDGISRKAMSLGLRKKITPWSPEEDRFIKKNVKRMTNEELARALGRNKATVGARVRKLGVQRHGIHRWTNQERIVIERMHGKHSIAHIAQKLGLRVKQVEGQVQVMQLYKKGSRMNNRNRRTTSTEKKGAARS